MVFRMFNNYKMDYQKMDELFAINSEAGIKRPGQSVDSTPEIKRKKEITKVGRFGFGRRG